MPQNDSRTADRLLLDATTTRVDGQEAEGDPAVADGEGERAVVAPQRSHLGLRLRRECLLEVCRHLAILADALVELLVPYGHPQRGRPQAEALAQVDERAAQRGSQVVAANQIDRERLQQLHALRALPRGCARGAEAADEVGEHERDQHVDDERGDARRRFDAERVVRLGEEEVERQRAHQREGERERAAAIRGHQGRQQQHESDRSGVEIVRAAARAPRSRPAAGTAKPRPTARRARPPPRPVRGGGGGSRRRGGRAHSRRSQLREGDVEPQHVDAAACRGSRACGPARGRARVARRARARAPVPGRRAAPGSAPPPGRRRDPSRRPKS